MNKEQINISQEYQYLQFVDFRDLWLWDAKSYAKNSLVSGKYELVKITKLLKKQRSKIEIQNDQIYKQLTVRLYGNGVILRKEEFGKNIKTKNQYIAKSGQLVFSRIDARSGAFGIVPDSLDGAIVTNDFPIYSINNDVALSDYLRLIISSPSFTEICKSKSSGTTGRLRMSEIDFENIKVPQPPISKQKELIASYNQKTIEAEAKEQKANQLEKSIDEYLIKELGIELPQEEAKQNHFLRFVEFKDLSRWDVDYNKYVSDGVFNFKSKYEVVPLRKAIDYFQYGTSNKANQSNGTTILRMNNILKGELDLLNIKYVNDLSEKELKPLILNKGDILFNRTNGKELVGKTCVFDVDGNYVFASYLIRIRLKTNFNPYCINYLFRSSIIRNQIDAISRQITGQANINSVEMGNLLFPLPPLPIQNQIADRISSIKQEIKTLRNEAENLKIQAKEEFENEVF